MLIFELTASPSTFGRRFFSGTRTSSMTICPVSEALSENLPSIFGVLKPFIERSKTKPRILLSSHLAQTTAMSAIGEFVIHDLLPLRIHVLVEASNLARVSMPPGSEPWFGSVNPKQPMISPLASAGNHRSRCSSVPYSCIGCITSEDCTLNADL